METKRFNRRLRFTIQWSPLLLVCASVWLFLSFRQGPVHMGFIISGFGIGLLCGGLIILDFWKHPARNFLALPFMIFLSGQTFLKEIFFSGWGMDLTGLYYQQYLAIVLISILIWVVAIRHSVRKYLSQTDVEQFVGPERGSTVL